MELSEEALGELFSFMNRHLDEKQRRLLAGSMARALGRGGATKVASASSMSRNTVIAGGKDVEAELEPSDRVRREGGGRPRLIDVDPDLLSNLDEMVDRESRGDPMSPLRWTLKSTRQLARALGDMGHQVSSWTVGQLLHAMGYSLQATAKTVEGAVWPAAVRARASSLVDFAVHRNGDIGSPRDSRSTISSSNTNSSGSRSILRLRPPPGRRTRSDGPAPPANSRAPTIKVLRARPDASATRRWPPRPNRPTAAAPTNRCWRSSNNANTVPKNSASPSSVTSTATPYTARVIQTRTPTGTRTRNHSCGTRPPTRSSTDSRNT